jgi:hypothetical protein
MVIERHDLENCTIWSSVLNAAAGISSRVVGLTGSNPPERIVGDADLWLRSKALA